VPEQHEEYCDEHLQKEEHRPRHEVIRYHATARPRLMAFRTGRRCRQRLLSCPAAWRRAHRA
jgi:hypothetical protein